MRHVIFLFVFVMSGLTHAETLPPLTIFPPPDIITDTEITTPYSVLWSEWVAKEQKTG